MAPPAEADLSGDGAVSALLGSITGRHQVDGIVGIVLGLYVSSFPARHFVDMLLYWKTEGARLPTRRSFGWWIALNGGVLLSGFVTIVYAAARFTAGGRVGAQPIAIGPESAATIRRAAFFTSTGSTISDGVWM